MKESQVTEFQAINSWEMDPGTFRHFREVLVKTGRLRARVVSDSMEPLLRVGQFVELEPVRDPATLRRFDIVVCHAGDRLLCHYVWNFSHLGRKATLTTRSLKQSLHDDLPVAMDEVLGRVVNQRISGARRVKIILWNLLRKTA